MSFRFSIDRGGTFTDVFAEVPAADGGVAHRTLKLLSVDPANYSDAPTEGIRYAVLPTYTHAGGPPRYPVRVSVVSRSCGS